MIEDALKKFNKYMADKWDEHIHKFPEADTSQWNSGFTVAQEIAENFLSHSVQEAKAERDNWWIKNLDIKEGRRYSMWRDGNNINYLDETNLYLDTKSKIDKVDNERK